MRVRTFPALGIGLLALSLTASLTPIATAQARSPLAVQQGEPPGSVTPDETAAVCAENSGPGNGQDINAQNWGSPWQDRNTFGAADFELLSKCKVTAVRIWGVSEGEADKVLIWIYQNGPDDLPTPPGTSICSKVHSGDGPNFRIPIADCKLKSGRYWLAAQVAQNYVEENRWDWMSTERKGLADAWRNPGDGFGLGCTTWDTVDDCLDVTGDYRFSLRGR